MAKEQRSNKEKRKPKQDKIKPVVQGSPFAAAPAPGMTKGKGAPAKKR